MTPPTLQELSEALVRSAPHTGVQATIRSSKLRASIALVCADALMLTLVMVAAISVRAMTGTGSIPLDAWAPIVGAVILANAFGSLWRGIYPGYGMCAISELRSTFYTLTGVFAAVIAISFFTRGVLPYARSILLFAYVFSVPMLAVSRMAVRRLLSRKPWYGIPVIIVGEHGLAAKIVDSLRVNTHIGLRPMVIIEPDEEHADYGYHHSVPVIGGVDTIHPLARRFGVSHGIIALPHATSEQLAELLERSCQSLTHFTFVGEHVNPSVMWISNVQSDLLMSAEIEHRLRQPALRLKKRLFDLVVAVPLFLICLPFMLAIAVAIRLTSKGSILYRQKRVGYKGRHFDLIKFRTMVNNADGVLADMLERNPKMKEEYQRFHKLKVDPRITRIGQWLRKFSMDELPQLWNVLRGDMTLVGSRPVLPSEMQELGADARRMYMNMHQGTKPGLTGLWQVTVRATAEFDQRVHIDQYYIRNWSLFLDIHILLRTVGVVMTGRGGY